MQAKLEWKEEYSVGNDKLDNQHKKLFAIANSALEYHYNEELPYHVRKQKVKVTLHQLSEYIKTHMLEEERYMKSSHYPDYEEHKSIHKNIIAMTNNVLNSSKSFSELEKGLTHLLDTIFVNHIITNDKAIEEWSQQRGGVSIEANKYNKAKK
jgi:hemerythrin